MRVSSGRVLVVEGADEANLVGVFLERLGIRGVDVQDVLGKDNFRKEIPTILKMTREGPLEMLGVMRDADEDSAGAFDSIANILIDLGLTPPGAPNTFSRARPAVGIFIVEGTPGSGMLEDLCLRTVKEHPAMECVSVFWECASLLDDPPRNPAKAKAHAFLAAMPNLVKSVGVGARRGYWNLDSDAFAELRAFFKAMGEPAIP